MNPEFKADFKTKQNKNKQQKKFGGVSSYAMPLHANTKNEGL